MSEYVYFDWDPYKDVQTSSRTELFAGKRNTETKNPTRIILNPKCFSWMNDRSRPRFFADTNKLFLAAIIDGVVKKKKTFRPIYHRGNLLEKK